jgi:hypothetical protein
MLESIGFQDATQRLRRSFKSKAGIFEVRALVLLRQS